MNTRYIHCSFAAITIGLLALAQGCAQNPQSFYDPELAATMLTNAVRVHNPNQLKQILGSSAQDVLSSGDPIADRAAGDKFVEKYDEKHKLVPDKDGALTLVIGKNEWPCPIPLVKDEKGGWYWDIEEGREELINRRIGRNELSTIQTCLAIADAQREYVTSDPNHDGVPEYAMKFMSDPDTHNGLYWKTEPGEPMSPLGPLVADAAEQGYTSAKNAAGEPAPYHGYFFKMLTSQGEAAREGAFDYVIGGKMIGGFGVIAWPANYAVSGVMSFMISADGVVYECDLGEATAAAAKAMTRFDPAPPWKPIEAKEAADAD